MLQKKKKKEHNAETIWKRFRVVFSPQQGPVAGFAFLRLFGFKQLIILEDRDVQSWQRFLGDLIETQ